VTSILGALRRSPDLSRRFLRGAAGSVCLDDLVRRTSLSGRVEELADRSVLIWTRDQVTAAVALAELDGVARRLVVCPSDVSPDHLRSVAARADVDAIVSDRELPAWAAALTLRVGCRRPVEAAGRARDDSRVTEWVLLTSGTTGAPKLIVHTIESLTAAIRSNPAPASATVWGTFYDIRRYGGLQILLRALLGSGSFVLSDAAESIGDFLVRLGRCGVTHLSGTPSHWRRVVMSPQAAAIAPRYVRLSGEIADQPILNALRSCYPMASVAHAYASTEAGVGFEVNDGLEGFPASVVGFPGAVEIKIVDGSIRVRSARVATRYIGERSEAIVDSDGFVDTGDMVERRGDRYYFLGRKSGVINIAGLKVYPEEIEAVINEHRAVRMSIVRSRKSPIAGSLVSADVVLKESALHDGADLKREILQVCRQRLAAHKVPTTIRFVPALELDPAGKVARHAG
jgi:acyl-coenzyme A synthetase/AMP-(fatty) acid ligase